jgi:hypothetical protein
LALWRPDERTSRFAMSEIGGGRAKIGHHGKETDGWIKPGHDGGAMTA